ncbi:MAG: uroporphyrinogen decarboxylase [Runella slithyformis]|nr:MAG: uroporphyrinogen decarboxylase [Runella sp.]TAG21239.1 MAG: uroporphyrinogen decarboxylase [Cytophagales bacterium]TAG40330.1 MAG: uroporphyrinogen decarboxylase [Cytophagia bacterium]TAG58424.1 MAG: uroporphyrinogen decarboxylase [Runella slithyformis]TAG74460.1 MAG: uroporphyrinogen decarboxylase [Runella slithyformis]
MESLQNDLLLRAALGQKTERTPVWMMRQAGRILAEYRAVRQKAGSFIQLATTPELAAEVTIQPVDLLGVDAAIIFSDILVVPEAMGLPYEMEEKRGPIFPKTVHTLQDVAQLRVADPEADLGYVLEAIKITKRELNGRVPLIGFAGAPFTIFCYMTEGKGSKTFSVAKKALYTDPEFSHQLLQKITDSTIAYLKAQIAAGANLVQIFDSWAGILSPDQYYEFSLPYIRQICDAIAQTPPNVAVPQTPVTVFAKGAFFARHEIGQLNCAVVGLDWNMDIAESRALIPSKTLQGNLDPCVLYGSYKQIEAEVKKMLNAFGPERHIANLGHGVYPDTDPDKVRCFIDAVKAYSV